MTAGLGPEICEHPWTGAQARDQMPEPVAALCDLAMGGVVKQLDRQNMNPLWDAAEEWEAVEAKPR